MRKFGTKLYKLGRGAYGKVYAVEDENGNKIAVKVSENYTNDITYGVDGGFLNEMGVLSRVNHPNVQKLISANIDTYEHKYYIASHIGKYNLRTLMGSNIYYDVKDIAYQIALGLNHLHNRNIITGDLKPENIIIYKKENRIIPVIIDFGIATIDDCSKYIDNTNIRYSAMYRPPELLVGDSFNKRADSWAFGIILYELVNRKILFKVKYDDEENLFNLRKQIVSYLGYKYEDDYQIFYDDLPDNIPQLNLDIEDPILKDLILKLLSISPYERISIFEALEHPYFDDIKISNPENIEYESCTDVIDSLVLDKSQVNDYYHDTRELFFDNLFLKFNNLLLCAQALQIYDRYTISNEPDDPEFVMAICALLSANMISYSFKLDDIYHKPFYYDTLEETIFDIVKELNYNLFYPTFVDYIYVNIKNYDNIRSLMKKAYNFAIANPTINDHDVAIAILAKYDN